MKPGNERVLTLSLVFFILVFVVFMLFLKTMVGCPGLLTGPWSLDAMAALKKSELTIYGLIVFGVPSLALLLTRCFVKSYPPSASPVVSPVPTFTRSKLYRMLVYFLIPAGFYLMLLSPYSSGPVEPMNEGLRVTATHQFMNGKKPYSEIFFQYGIGMEIIQPRTAFFLFGTTLEAHRRMEYFMAPLGRIAAYYLALIVLRGSPLILFFPILLIGRPDGGVIWARAALPLLSLALVLLQHRWALFLSGCLLFLGFLYSVEAGLLVGGAMALYFLLTGIKEKNIRSFGWFVAGGFLGAIPFFVWLLISGGVSAFFWNTFSVGQTLLSAWGKPTPLLCEPLISLLKNPLVVFSYSDVWVRWWLPPFVYLAVLTGALATLLWGRSSRRHSFLLLSLSGLLYFVVALGRSDLEHWQKAVPVYFILLFALLQAGLDQMKKKSNSLFWRGKSCALVLFLIFFLLRFFHWDTLLASFSYSRDPVETPVRSAEKTRLGALDLSPEEWSAHLFVVRTIQKYLPENKPLFNFTDHAIYPFLSHRVHLTRYACISFVASPSMEEEVLAELVRSRPPLVLAQEEGNTIFAKPHHARIRNFILEHYSPVERANNFVFLVPKG